MIHVCRAFGGLTVLLLILTATPAWSQDGSHDLARKLSNPVSDSS